MTVLHDDFGVPTDFRLSSISAMSADGTQLVGGGVYRDVSFSWQMSLTPPPLAADANFDGQVSLSDFGALKAGLRRSDRPFRRYGNFDGDLDVDMDDFGVLKATFGERQAQASPVPEPSAYVLFAIGALAACGLRPKEKSR